MRKLLAFILAPLLSFGQVTITGLKIDGVTIPVAPPATTFQGFGSATVAGTASCVASNAATLNTCLGRSNVHITFSAGGTYTGTFVTTGNFVFIDCFSAPSAVTLTGGDASGAVLHINNVHDVIVQGCRFRNCNASNSRCVWAGDSTKLEGQVGTTTWNVVLDHNEFITADDEVIDIAYIHDVTFSWNIVSNGNTGGSGCQGDFFGDSHITSHHNLYVTCTGSSSDTRVPLIGSGWSCCFNPALGFTDLGMQADVQWNVAANFPQFGFIAATDNQVRSWGNLVGNYYDNTLMDDSSHWRNTEQFPAQTQTLWYLAGNMAPNSTVGAPSGYYSGNVDGNFATPTSPFCMTNSNKIDCTTLTVFNPGASCAASGIAANSCQSATIFANTAPVTGPCVFDNPTRITEWTNVINGAGVVSHFADDATVTALRAKVKTPTLTMLGQSWNTQVGGC